MKDSVTIGYSPCPNDTFIFYALVHKKIDNSGIIFREVLHDVETLNQMALKAALDVTKVSSHAYGYLRDNYIFLRSGGALGIGCGPLIVAKKPYQMVELKDKIIAVPGRLTTAYLLLQLFDLSLEYKIKPMAFHRIMDAVRSEQVDAGLIIHEGRFTYREYGLTEVMDLGQWWEAETALPIPLGGILAKRKLGEAMISAIERLIQVSIRYAFQHRKEPINYIKKHSQELSEDIIKKHIDLYVNDYALNIGENGMEALRELIGRAEHAGILPPSKLPLFLETNPLHYK